MLYTYPKVDDIGDVRVSTGTVALLLCTGDDDGSAVTVDCAVD